MQSPVEGFPYPQFRGCLSPCRLLVYSQQPSQAKKKKPTVYTKLCTLLLFVCGLHAVIFPLVSFRHSQILGQWLEVEVCSHNWVYSLIYLIDLINSTHTDKHRNTITKKHLQNYHTPLFETKATVPWTSLWSSFMWHHSSLHCMNVQTVQTDLCDLTADYQNNLFNSCGVSSLWNKNE